MHLRSAAKTHVGLVRKNNEDSFLCDDGAGLYAVIDGMGGHAAGEVASRQAIDGLHLSWYAGQDFTDAFETADRTIREDIAEHPERASMGTTLTALGFNLVDGIARIAHVGDSRGYWLRDGVAQRLTNDHAVGNVLSNCLGCYPGAHRGTDIRSVKTKPGDVFVLCTDGLSNYVSAEDAVRIISDTRKLHALFAADLHLWTKALIEYALNKGGSDNITVVVAAVE